MEAVFYFKGEGLGEIIAKRIQKNHSIGMVQQQDVAYLRPYFLLKRSTRPSA